MTRIRKSIAGLCGLLLVLGGGDARATETENWNLQILPAPGRVTVDGKTGDWDLSGSIFACGDVEKAAATYAVWFAAMYDRDNLYVLARWRDATPMNNPGSTKGDHGFKGDCLQFRLVTAPDVTAPEVTSRDRTADDAPSVRTSHITAWRGSDKNDLIQIEYGRRLNEGGIKDAKAQGAKQAFAVLADGYVQEIAIPWKLLVKPGVTIQPGSRILITLEPNFTVGTDGRLTIKDIFKPKDQLDRVFTFQKNDDWGYGELLTHGKVTPHPVRLSTGIELPVRLEKGVPVVDLGGLEKKDLPEGFKKIKVTMPEDGYVSLNLFAPDGTVARQLLVGQQLKKGEHEILWDGLATMSAKKPGDPVPAGQYTWEGFYHKGLHLRLRGWAGNSGPAPWLGWGADHGNPVACAAANGLVYAGWAGGEADKPLVACDTKGNILWKNIRGGIAGATLLATDGKTVYAFNPIGQYAATAIYRVDARTGAYSEWSALKSPDLTMKALWGDAPDAPKQPSGLAAAPDNVFVSFYDQNAVLVVDAATGRVKKKLDVPKPLSLAAKSADLIYVVSEGKILEVKVPGGEIRPVVTPETAGTAWPSALALDPKGNLYVAMRGEPADSRVLVYSPDGKLQRKIGREGGRALLGKWTPDGMLNPSGLAVDTKGQLWVAEDDDCPRRVSVWDAWSGAFRFEMFGASTYGATGGAINPDDPFLMVGSGCEWRIDSWSGKGAILGTITREGMGASRFGHGSNGKLYLAITPEMLHGRHPVRIFERLGDANYKLRTVLYPPADGQVRVWADENGDEKEQPEEVRSYAIDLGAWIQGWYLSMAPDLSFYGTLYKISPTGFTACGAPQYDLSQAVKMAGPSGPPRGGMGAQLGQGSEDGKFMLYNAAYGMDRSTNDCYDIATGKLLWTYPSNFTGVHGSHRATAAEQGMLRGAYDIAGTAKLPPPIGNIWVIPTNKGEWHALTEKGFYLARFFEGDPMKVSFPPKAGPGANLDACPPGAGEEAFGGSIAYGGGKLSLQGGHSSFWNVEVTGLETVRPLPGGSVTLTDDDLKLAGEFRERYLRAENEVKEIEVKRLSPTFTGDLSQDFAGSTIAKYQKNDEAACRTALAWDATTLYIGWEVKDSTPWVNGADSPEFLYARGDTVDLQIGANPGATRNRKEAVLGDLRLSIGPFQGQPTAVIYRKVATEKNPKVFNSGVVKNYQMDSVLTLPDVKVAVKVDAAGKRYVVEAAIPLETLGLKPSPGLTLYGDFGVTHGDKDKADTVLRTYWSNQSTGLVSDEVLELAIDPSAWGAIKFK